MLPVWIGVDLRVEDATSHGRADMVVLTGGRVFVLEFKMADGNNDTETALDAAMAQMRDRGYAEKYRGRGEPVHLAGVAWGREARNILQIRAESYPVLPGHSASPARSPAPAPPGTNMPAPVTLSDDKCRQQTRCPERSRFSSRARGKFPACRSGLTNA